MFCQTLSPSRIHSKGRCLNGMKHHRNGQGAQAGQVTIARCHAHVEGRQSRTLPQFVVGLSSMACVSFTGSAALPSASASARPQEQFAQAFLAAPGAHATAGTPRQESAADYIVSEHAVCLSLHCPFLPCLPAALAPVVLWCLPLFVE